MNEYIGGDSNGVANAGDDFAQLAADVARINALLGGVLHVESQLGTDPGAQRFTPNYIRGRVGYQDGVDGLRGQLEFTGEGLKALAGLLDGVENNARDISDKAFSGGSGGGGGDDSGGGGVSGQQDLRSDGRARAHQVYRGEPTDGGSGDGSGGDGLQGDNPNGQNKNSQNQGAPRVVAIANPDGSGWPDGNTDRQLQRALSVDEMRALGVSNPEDLNRPITTTFDKDEVQRLIDAGMTPLASEPGSPVPSGLVGAGTAFTPLPPPTVLDGSVPSGGHTLVDEPGNLVPPQGER